MRYLVNVPLLLIRLLLTALVYATPILGVWLVSSLVAYVNGPMGLSLLSGILLFPLLPITWELMVTDKRKRKGQTSAQILTFGDRLTLRTLVLNLSFIALLLALRPQTAFLALSTRGDWMLENVRGPQVELVRQTLFKIANRLEWLYVAVRNNPYEQYAKDTHVVPTPRPQPDRSGIGTTQPQQNTPGWPWEGSALHPAVANMPASAEVSIESVARYIAQQEPDPLLRVKALHDYVADRVAYDAPSYFAGQYPPQDAETVFRTRKAVCAGYAKLLEALGRAIGEEIILIPGDARTRSSDLSGQGHAWNAAKIQGNWYLIDATWDSGYVDSSGFTKKYRTDYLFVPPEVMVISHFPNAPAWQLLPTPLSRGDFLRQPMLQPQFFAQGLKLLSPVRSQTDVTDAAVLQIDNPKQRFLKASFALKGAQPSTECAGQPSSAAQITCPLPMPGTYEVNLFSDSEQYGQYAYIGQVEFNRQ